MSFDALIKVKPAKFSSADS